jgi:RNA polymerase sigma factor (sigma-70 family)
MRSEAETNRVIDKYGDTVKRICILHLKNQADTEDVFQTVFLKFLLKDTEFESEEHEKAWFIRVTINACKDLIKSFFRKNTVSLDEVMECPAELSEDNAEVLEAVLSLPEKYKDVVYLHYYEGYTAPQISEMLGKKVNSVYTLLTRARTILKEKLGGDGHARTV